MPDHSAHDVEFVRDPAALFRWLLEGVLVLGPAAEGPLRITAPGDALWALLEEPHTTATLVAELSDAFGAPQEAVRVDIQPVLSALRDTGAIRAVARPR